MAIGGGGLRGVKRALALTLGFLVFGLFAMCFETTDALAQDWKFESNLSQRFGYNSNLLLQPDRKISGFSSRTTPEIKLSRIGLTSDVSLLGRFDFNQYIDNSDLNSEDQFVQLKASNALSERSTVAFDGSFDHDTNLESDEDATGRFVNDVIRFIRWDASPSWQYLLSPIDRVRVSARYTQVDYDTSEKTDYRNYGPAISYSHDISELASIFASLNYSRFEPDEEVDTSQDVYGGLIGYDYHPTERFSVSAAGGLNYNVTHEEGSKDSGEIGYRFQFNLDYLLSEQTKANLALSRDSEPSGDGQLRTRNRASVGFSHKLTEMTVFTFDASYIQDQRTQSNSGVGQRLQVKPALRWNITEDLSLQAAYQFRYKQRESNGSAIDNGAFITLRYALPDLHWSGF